MSHGRFGRSYFIRRTRGSSPLAGRAYAFLVSAVKGPFWRRIIRKRVKAGKLLDIGCAEGYLLRWAESSGYAAFGIDVSDYAIRDLSRKNAPRSTLCVGSVVALPFMEGCFDIVTCFDVLEHLEEPVVALCEIGRCLRYGGILILSTPSLLSWGRKSKGPDWFAYRDPTHVSLLAPGRWKQLLNESGFDIVDEFYDVLWDAPYVRFVPTFLQRAASRGLQIIHYWVPLRLPPSCGESLYLVASKRQR